MRIRERCRRAGGRHTLHVFIIYCHFYTLGSRHQTQDNICSLHILPLPFKKISFRIPQGCTGFLFPTRKNCLPVTRSLAGALPDNPENVQNPYKKKRPEIHCFTQSISGRIDTQNKMCLPASLTKTRALYTDNDPIFCHPDYTVGSGITPESCLAARGLARTYCASCRETVNTAATKRTQTVYDYRRWGLTPALKIYFDSLSLYPLRSENSIDFHLFCTKNILICHIFLSLFQISLLYFNRKNGIL